MDVINEMNMKDGGQVHKRSHNKPLTAFAYPPIALGVR